MLLLYWFWLGSAYLAGWVIPSSSKVCSEWSKVHICQVCVVSDGFDSRHVLLCLMGVTSGDVKGCLVFSLSDVSFYSYLCSQWQPNDKRHTQKHTVRRVWTELATCCWSRATLLMRAQDQSVSLHRQMDSLDTFKVWFDGQMTSLTHTHCRTTQ